MVCVCVWLRGRQELTVGERVTRMIILTSHVCVVDTGWGDIGAGRD